VLDFFCKTGDDSTQRAGAIFRNLIAHLYEKIHDHFPKLFEESTKILAKAQYKGGVGKGRLEYAKSVKNLKPALEDLAKLHGKPVFIILDALDECNDRRKEGLANSLRGMIDTSANIKILVASRPETDLVQDFAQTPKIDLRDNKINSEKDIKAYLVGELNKLSSCTPKERKTALKKIIERSEGMFRYANLAVDRLRQPWRRPIEKHLATYPKGLEAFYRQRFQQIQPELQEVLVMTLRWTILAKGDVTPLIVAEDYRRVFDDGENDEDDDGTSGTNSDDGGGEERDNEEINEEVVTGGAGAGGGQKVGDDIMRKENENGRDLETEPTDDSRKSKDNDLAAQENEEANKKNTDESDGMLNDTLKHIQEAGSVFIESTDKIHPLRLRHTSVKDFVLEEGSKYASISLESLCPLCASDANEQISLLSITPKHGHLILSLTICKLPIPAIENELLGMTDNENDRSHPSKL